MNFKGMTDDQLWDYLKSLKDENGVTHDPIGAGHFAHEELMSRPNSFRIGVELVSLVFRHSFETVMLGMVSLNNQEKNS
jgi:hypothetical protein